MSTTPQEIALPFAAATPSAANRSRSRRGIPQASLETELRRFAAGHPDGWNHDEWIQLLGQLARDGYDTANQDAIGRSLEVQRLDLVLEGIPGVGGKRRGSIVDRYGRLCNLQQAGVEEIASVAGVSRRMAERIVERIR